MILTRIKVIWDLQDYLPYLCLFICTESMAIHLINTRPEHAPLLDALQKIVFPTLSPDELMGERHYHEHLKVFPEGQFVVVDEDRVVGMTTTMRHHLTLEDHTFLEISGNMLLSTHESDGDWLYGLDVGVHPDYRGRGLAKQLYRARQELCRQLGLKGQVTVGMPNGYLNYAHEMDLDTYFEALKAGQLTDPTVSAQQKTGFEIIRLIHNYLEDPQCGNGGVLMVLPVEKIV